MKTWWFAIGLGAMGSACGAEAGVLPPPPSAERAAEPGEDAEGCGTPRGCAEAEEPAALGQHIAAADLPATWLTGTPDRAEAVSVLVFWEVWCPHCQREMPALVALDDREDVQVIGLTRLSRGATEEQVRAFVAEHGIDYPIGVDDRGLGDRLGVNGVPFAVVVRDGDVVWQGHPQRIDDAALGSR